MTQRTQKQTKRMQRLPQVMTGSCQKATLGDNRPLGNLLFFFKTFHQLSINHLGTNQFPIMAMPARCKKEIDRQKHDQQQACQHQRVIVRQDVSYT